jgi:hypothetical protein
VKGVMLDGGSHVHCLADFISHLHSVKRVGTMSQKRFRIWDTPSTLKLIRLTAEAILKA